MPKPARAAALLLEVMIGLLIILVVVLIVASLFPSSYNTGLQAARLSNATHLGRQILERQKSLPYASATNIGNQTYQSEFEVQGRPVNCEFFYRVDRQLPSSLPPVYVVTVEWLHNSKVKQVVLAGSGTPP